MMWKNDVKPYVNVAKPKRQADADEALGLDTAEAHRLGITDNLNKRFLEFVKRLELDLAHAFLGDTQALA